MKIMAFPFLDADAFTFVFILVESRVSLSLERAKTDRQTDREGGVNEYNFFPFIILFHLVFLSVLAVSLVLIC